MNSAIAAIVVTYQSGSTIDACLSRLRQAQDVAEIDMNPILVKPEGEGVLVLDALMVPTAHNPSAT